MMKETLKLKTNQVALDNFKSFVSARNYKRPQMYISAVFEFLNWLEVHGVGQVTKVKPEDLINYSEYLTTRPNTRLGGTLSDSSIKGHYFAFNLLSSMLLESGIIQRAYTLPAFGKREKEDRTILTVDEVKEVISYCNTPLEKNIINIAYGCGLRRNEIEQLNTNDILFNNGYLVVRQGKKGKRREVPLTNSIISDLKYYIINERPKLLKETNQRETALFVNPKGKRMTGDNINDTFRYIQHRTGNEAIISKNVTLHGLRASISTHLQEAGAKMEFIQDFLGHAEMDTTQIYVIRRRRRIKAA